MNYRTIPKPKLIAHTHGQRAGQRCHVCIEQRFWSKVQLDSSGCWLWHGTILKPKGYGQFSVPFIGRAKIAAHIYSYYLKTGRTPNDDHLCVLHRCDTPACVRPSHLWLGTNEQNTLDMRRKGRAFNNTGKNHPMFKDGRHARSARTWLCRCDIRVVTVAEFDATCNICGEAFELKEKED